MTLDGVLDLFPMWWRTVKDSLGRERPWLLLGATKLTYEEIGKQFDRKDLNKELKEIAKKLYDGKGKESGKKLAQLEMEVDFIASLHKSFLLRHRNRLQYYRDDLVQKRTRTQGAFTEERNEFNRWKKNLKLP